MIQNLIPTKTTFHTGSTLHSCRSNCTECDPLLVLGMAAVVGTMGNMVTKGPSSHPEILAHLANLAYLPKPINPVYRFIRFIQ